MAIASVSASAAKLSFPDSLGTKPDAHGNRSFAEVLQQTRLAEGIFNFPLHRELVSFQDRILDGGGLSARELIYYQVRAAQFGLQVELVSKLAESLLSVSRRLQNPQ